jgi:hypothetical protein
MERMRKENLQLDCSLLFFNARKESIGLRTLFPIQNEKDMEYLSSITTGKTLPLIRYHLCTLKKESRPKWSEMEDKILYQILAV